ncbi:MAG: hypothetical protein KGJ03_06410 [Betaproteobacteria bacterium]|nr:hypothetical protein [Betaproteobacteria bacterium]MDE2153009.1 hypothetical protein [Betaproteobacteria bacterium]
MPGFHRSTPFLIEVPDNFPEAKLSAFLDYAGPRLVNTPYGEPWQEFGGASNLILWRFRTCCEEWEAYKAFLAAHSNPDFEELYRRERALFGMFTAGVSCLDSTVYSLAALASHPHMLGIAFGPSQQRACCPAALRQWLAPHASAAPLVDVLDQLLNSAQWELLVDLRNRMMHRSPLPRVIKAWMGTLPPVIKPLHFASTSSTPALEEDLHHFDALVDWLASTLSALLDAGARLK